MLTDSQGECMLAWGKSSHDFGFGHVWKISQFKTETVTSQNKNKHVKKTIKKKDDSTAHRLWPLATASGQVGRGPSGRAYILPHKSCSF